MRELLHEPHLFENLDTGMETVFATTWTSDVLRVRLNCKRFGHEEAGEEAHECPCLDRLTLTWRSFWEASSASSTSGSKRCDREPGLLGTGRDVWLSCIKGIRMDLCTDVDCVVLVLRMYVSTLVFQWLSTDEGISYLETNNQLDCSNLDSENEKLQWSAEHKAHRTRQCHSLTAIVPAERAKRPFVRPCWCRVRFETFAKNDSRVYPRMTGRDPG